MVPFLRKPHLLALLSAIFTAIVCLLLGAKPNSEGKDQKGDALLQKGDPLPQGALARLGTVRFHNPEPIHTVAFAPDGQALLVFAHEYPNSALRLWNIADGQELARFDLKDAQSPDAGYTRGVCLTPDGKGIVLRRENVVELVDRQS